MKLLPDRSETLSTPWPATIPLTSRRKLDTGRGSFCWAHEFDRNTGLVDVPVSLSGHVLMIAVRGEVLIEAFGRRVLLRSGDALMLGDCGFRITEVASGISGHGEIHYFIFDHRVVGRELGSNAPVESLCWKNSAPDSYFQSIRGVAGNVFARAHSSQLRYPYAFSAILRILVNFHVPASFFSILSRTYFKPRASLSAFLERHVLSARTMAEIAENFPLGSREFFRQFSQYHVQTPENWLRRRRMELARVLLGYGDAGINDVASAIGYTKKGEFHRDAPAPLRERLESIQRVGSHADLSTGELQRLARPFWIPLAPLEAMPIDTSSFELDAETLADIAAHPANEAVDKIKAFIDGGAAKPPEPPTAAIEDFWAMKTTGVGTIITLPEWLNEEEKIAA